MMTIRRSVVGYVLGLWLLPSAALAECDAVAALELPDSLRVMLRAEMQQMASGATALSVQIASGEWDAVRATAAAMRDGYILARELSPEQRVALKAALPKGFRDLDQAFHAQADRLAAAEGTLDPQWAAYQLSRLIEGCAECHARYASERFPGFGCQVTAGHHH